MPKYLIDIPDGSDTEYAYDQDTKELKFPSPRIDPTSFMGLEIVLTKVVPYEEPNRKAIEDEVWCLAREIAYGMSLQECIDTGMLHDDDIYDSASGVLEKLTYQEAKAKFDAWKTEREQIHVGDEVIDKDVGKAIVTNKDFEVCSVLWFDGSVSEDVPLGDLHKTGRHFDDIVYLLKKVQEEE